MRTDSPNNGMSGSVRTKAVLYALIQCTWGAAQTAMGLCLFVLCRLRRRPFVVSGGVVSTFWARGDGISLGLFTFSPPNGALLAHERGHTLQSALLGPLYLPAVLLPSLLWCGLPFFRRLRRTRRIPYSALYCERWADYVGGRRYAEVTQISREQTKEKQK